MSTGEHTDNVAGQSGQAPAPRTSLSIGWVLLASATFSATLLCLIGIWRRYDLVLGLSTAAVSATDKATIYWMVWSAVWVCLLPGAIWAAAFERIGRRRAGLVGGWCLQVALGSVFVLDATVYYRFGIHVADFADLASAPEAGDMAGGLVKWVLHMLWTVVMVGTITGVGTVFVMRLDSWLGSGGGGRGYGMWNGLALLVVLALVLVPLGWRGWVKDPWTVHRAWLAMPFEPLVAPPPGMNPALENPVLQKIDAAVKSRFHRLYPRLTSPLPPDRTPRVTPQGKTPNVVLLVMESLRPEALYGEDPWMPRLARWSQTGLRFERHSAGTNVSECGLFALLYARSPLFFKPTVGQALTPQMLHTFNASGYRTIYSPSLRDEWRGLEIFMSEMCFNEVVPAPDPVMPTWSERDRFALGSLAECLKNTGSPVFAVAFLHASHLPYDFPPEYARHEPVLDIESITVELASQFTPEAREPLINRYRNALAFLDDLVMDFIEALDRERTIVVVAGDHGEAFGEGGWYGHAYGLTDVSTRTPLVIVGPDVPERVVDRPTRHVDLMPTLLGLLNGRVDRVKRIHGRDALDGNDGTQVKVLSNQKQLAVVHGGARLLFSVEWEERHIELEGFVDEHGRPIPPPAIEDWRLWARAVIRELEAVLR